MLPLDTIDSLCGCMLSKIVALCAICAIVQSMSLVVVKVICVFLAGLYFAQLLHNCGDQSNINKVNTVSKLEQHLYIHVNKITELV